MRNTLLVASLFVAVGCGGPMSEESSTNPRDQMFEEHELRPTGKDVSLNRMGAVVAEHQDVNDEAGVSKTAKARGSGINYHGGPIMTGTPNIYTIWYGNWAGDANAQTVINAVANGLGGSPYYNINTTYYNASNVHLSNAAHFAGSTTDNYSQGTAVSDTGIQNIVSAAITSGRLPKDTNGVYFVLTSSDVNETSGFCTQYCGWHTNGTISGSDIKFAFIGGSARCPASCEWQNTGPNGGGSGDGMASIFSHEFEETTSDPDLNAWWQTSTGMENADKCAWTFGTTQTAANGAVYNVTMGGKQLLIQRNWVNSGSGSCAMSF